MIGLAVDEKEIILRQLKWLTVYHGELLKLEQPGMPLDRQQEVRRLRIFVPHHTALHVNLLMDALVSGLYSVFERPGWDQKTKDSQKITLEHFIQLLPAGSQKARGEALLKEVRASPHYRELCQVRGEIIGHSNRKTLLAYVGQPADAMFQHVSVDDLGALLGKAREIVLSVIDPYADFSIPEFHGIEELFQVIAAATKTSGQA